MKTFREYVNEASYPSKGSVAVVKGASGNRYAVFTKIATKSLWTEYWYNLDQLGDNTDYPRLRLCLNDYKEGMKLGKYCAYVNDKFAVLERPQYRKDDSQKCIQSSGVNFVNRAFREWLTTPAGQNFIEKNRIADCPTIRNWLEIASGKRNLM